jgi:hypothetical protein
MLARLPEFNKALIFFMAFIFMVFFSIQSQRAHASWFDKLSEILGGDEKPSSPSSNTQAISALTNADISQAFKQALDQGTDKVVKQLSQTNGFNDDATIRIPLPSQLETVRTWLDKVGMAGSMDDLEVRLNRAAEQAMPQTKQLFVDAISQMTFDDVRQIYKGPSDSATRYFQSKMTSPLTEAMTPVIDENLSQVGAIKKYDELMGAYKSIPLVPDIKADLTNHVVSGGLNGLFHYLAEQEAAIRQDPLRHTTDLLRKVFGK